MNRFSASEAALEGFRLTRERPGSIMAWSGVYFVGMLVIAIVMLRLLDPGFIDAVKKGTVANWDPETMGDMLANSAPAFLAVLIMAVFLMSTLTAAIYRIILRPGEKGFAYLRLGADELRLTIVNMLLFAVGLLCLATGFTVVALAAQAGAMLEWVAAIGMVVLTAWIGVRLSMATPMTFVTRKIAIREAWKLSQGAFWPLLGMIVLAVIFYLMVYILITVIGVAVVAVAGGQAAMADISRPTITVVIASLATLLMQLILSVLQVVMIYAPFAVAYEQLHGDVSVDPLRGHGPDAA